MMPGPAIIIANVSREFGLGSAAVKALCGLSLDIKQGARTAIVGPSGSGKTTLLNLIGALDRPSSGAVTVLGEEVSAFSEREASGFRRKHIGFVFQDDALIPELTVFENVELPLVFQRVSSRERRTKVHDLLERLGLSKRIKSFPPLLSGGEKQRAAVARAVIHGPKVLLADEPTANLDAVSAETVMKTIEELAQENGLTVLVSTHDQRVFSRFADLIRLNDGRLEV